jgi:hypothetical protein
VNLGSVLVQAPGMAPTATHLDRRPTTLPTPLGKLEMCCFSRSHQATVRQLHTACSKSKGRNPRRFEGFGKIIVQQFAKGLNQRRLEVVEVMVMNAALVTDVTELLQKLGCDLCIA